MKKIIAVLVLAFVLVVPLNVRGAQITDDMIAKSQLCVGDVCNSLKMIDGVYWLVENVSQVTFDGNENWALDDNDLTNTIRFRLPLSNSVNGSIGINDGVFEWITSGTSEIDTEHIQIASQRIILRINRNKVSNLIEFKQYLSENPLTIIYELATPIMTQINQVYNASIVEEFPNMEDFEIGNVFNALYQAMITLSAFVGSLWTWASSSVVLGISIPLLGDIWGITLTPLGIISGVGILVLVVAWLIKSLVPVA